MIRLNNFFSTNISQSDQLMFCSHPGVRVVVTETSNKRVVVARMLFDNRISVDLLGSSELIFIEIVKVILIHFIGYLDQGTKITIVPSVKSSTLGYNFYYTLGTLYL